MSKDAKKSVVLEAIEQWHRDQHAGELAVRRLEEQRHQTRDFYYVDEGGILCRPNRQAMPPKEAALKINELIKENTRLRDRLQIDPGGSDKIDELGQAMDFLRHWLEKAESKEPISNAYAQGYQHGLVDGERQAHGVKPHGPRKKDE